MCSIPGAHWYGHRFLRIAEDESDRSVIVDGRGPRRSPGSWAKVNPEHMTTAASSWDRPDGHWFSPARAGQG